MTISKEYFEICCRQMQITCRSDVFEKLDAYAGMLMDYNQKVNLTAITEPNDIIVKHFVDSLCLLKYVDIKDGATLCDVGTGAGFPGMVAKIARPDIQVTLFDSVNKKLDFIRFLCKELDVTTEIVTIRAEDAGKDVRYREKFDVVTARAVAGLNRLAEYCVPLVKVGGVFAPLKAALTKDEAQAGFGAAANLGTKQKDRILYQLPDASDREIIIFEKISQTSTRYPRNAAQIAKKPL